MIMSDSSNVDVISTLLHHHSTATLSAQQLTKHSRSTQNHRRTEIKHLLITRVDKHKINHDLSNHDLLVFIKAG